MPWELQGINSTPSPQRKPVNSDSKQRCMKVCIQSHSACFLLSFHDLIHSARPWPQVLVVLVPGCNMGRCLGWVWGSSAINGPDKIMPGWKMLKDHLLSFVFWASRRDAKQFCKKKSGIVRQDLEIEALQHLNVINRHSLVGSEVDRKHLRATSDGYIYDVVLKCWVNEPPDDGKKRRGCQEGRQSTEIAELISVVNRIPFGMHIIYQGCSKQW